MCKNFSREYPQGRNNVLLRFSKKVTDQEKTLIIVNHSFYQKGFQKSLPLRNANPVSFRKLKYDFWKIYILKLV
jgi:hypothetical protein